jgi:phosphate transport system substrate-binding protein
MSQKNETPILILPILILSLLITVGLTRKTSFNFNQVTKPQPINSTNPNINKPELSGNNFASIQGVPKSGW